MSYPFLFLQWLQNRPQESKNGRHIYYSSAWEQGIIRHRVSVALGNHTLRYLMRVLKVCFWQKKGPPKSLLGKRL